MERWLPVADFEGLYEVSNRGGVRSVDRTVFASSSRRSRGYETQRRGHVLKPAATKTGGSRYFHVSLYRDGHSSTHYVHTLVLAAFADPCPNGMEACHGAGGSLDNRWPENLSWDTHQKNMLDKYRDGTQITGSRAYNAKLTDDLVLEIRERYATGDVTQRALASELGVSAATINRVIKGAKWQHVPLRPQH